MIESLVGETEIRFMIDLGLCLFCGIFIGAERELKNKPAGISTQTLVISGAMMFAFLSQSLSPGDPTRIAAQIVSGVGFLGAGIILKSDSGDRVTNVTTAASIWYSAAIGMALGFDYHFIAIFASLFAVVVSRIPKIYSSGDI